MDELYRIIKQVEWGLKVKWNIAINAQIIRSALIAHEGVSAHIITDAIGFSWEGWLHHKSDNPHVFYPGSYMREEIQKWVENLIQYEKEKAREENLHLQALIH
jgi:NADH:ubiquinone oxidoreductase subunit